MSDVKRGRPVKFVVDFDTKDFTIQQVADRLGSTYVTAWKLLKDKPFVKGIRGKKKVVEAVVEEVTT